jgi:hypothetical protein
MKHFAPIAIFPVLFAFLLLSSCEDLLNKDDNTTKSSLNVKFKNSTSSTYTITTIQTRNRGKVQVNTTPTDSWGNNLLAAGQTLAPGAHFLFTLDISAGEWVEYRLGVDNGQGVTVMLYDQPGYDGFTNLPITHWGSDDRSVEVTITYNHDSNTINVTGWSDYAGIQN